MEPALIFFNANELLRFLPHDIVYITADHNYSNLVTASGDTRLISHQLGEIEVKIGQQLKAEAARFIRIGRGKIINRQYIYYINIHKLQLILKSPNGTLHTLTVPHDPLVLLKEIVANEIN